MTEVEICNLAISNCRSDKTITALTDPTTEARACNRFYAVTRNEILRKYPWPFATKRETLSLVSEDPNDEWDYSYRYPSGCLFFRRIVSDIRPELRSDRIPFKIERDNTGKLILTDEDDAIGEFTFLDDNTSRWPEDFCVALSYLLAKRIASMLGVDAKSIQAIHFLYLDALSTAGANSFNEEQPDDTDESEFSDARD